MTDISKTLYEIAAELEESKQYVDLRFVLNQIYKQENSKPRPIAVRCVSYDMPSNINFFATREA